MNSTLINLYVKGMIEDCFSEDHKTKENFEGIMEMYNLEEYNNTDRCRNPEYQIALQIVKSPLFKALT
jgi:hypothetical protein